MDNEQKALMADCKEIMEMAKEGLDRMKAPNCTHTEARRRAYEMTEKIDELAQKYPYLPPPPIWPDGWAQGLS